MENQEKTFDHETAEVSDKIALIGELEHIRAHAMRSAASLFNTENPNEFEWLHYAAVAEDAKNIRREYQKKNFPDLSEYDWCLCKAAARARQLVYETKTNDWAIIKRIDSLVDTIWGEALGLDLSDCYACREDKGEI